jgi:DNA-binding NtrC family response regulator
MTLASPNGTVLIADDDPTIRRNLALFLRSRGYTVVEACDGTVADRLVREGRFGVVLLDLKMPGPDGLELLRAWADRLDEMPVIVVTAYGGATAAIEAMKLGAYDYLTKPFDLDEVLFAVQRGRTQATLVAQVQALSAEPGGDDEDGELIGDSPAMLPVFKAIGRVAGTTEPVLITGESGTGKELVASAVHRYSERAGGPFVKVNCAALHTGLLESELFGHEKGAFTGAVAQRRGRFEQADGGTLLLDEIGEMDADLQSKLLRVLQTGRFERLGGEQTLRADVRILAATNRDLLAAIRAGRFREDLFYRLNVVAITLPPLRDRREDIPALAEHILRRLARKYKWGGLGLAPEALADLMNRPWPGNVRELQNVLARAAILARGRVVQLADLGASPTTVPGVQNGGIPSLREALAETERRVILRALEQEKWNRTQAARVLGISRRQLFDKIRLHDLHEPS